MQYLSRSDEMMITERIILKNGIAAPQKDWGEEKKKKKKTKNWIWWIELRKLPNIQDVFLGFGTLDKVEGLNHYANLPAYGLRTNQSC